MPSKTPKYLALALVVACFVLAWSLAQLPGIRQSLWASGSPMSGGWHAGASFLLLLLAAAPSLVSLLGDRVRHGAGLLAGCMAIGAWAISSADSNTTFGPGGAPLSHIGLLADGLILFAALCGPALLGGQHRLWAAPAGDRQWRFVIAFLPASLVLQALVLTCDSQKQSFWGSMLAGYLAIKLASTVGDVPGGWFALLLGALWPVAAQALAAAGLIQASPDGYAWPLLRALPLAAVPGALAGIVFSVWSHHDAREEEAHAHAAAATDPSAPTP